MEHFTAQHRGSTYCEMAIEHTTVSRFLVVFCIYSDRCPCRLIVWRRPPNAVNNRIKTP